MKKETHKDNLRSALEHLPQAPRNGEFAARLVRVATLTPQQGREAIMDSPLRFPLAWAAAGFSLGVALIFVCMIPIQSRLTPDVSGYSVASLSALTFDPLENTVAQIYSDSTAAEDQAQ